MSKSKWKRERGKFRKKYFMGTKINKKMTREAVRKVLQAEKH